MAAETGMQGTAIIRDEIKNSELDWKLLSRDY